LAPTVGRLGITTVLFVPRSPTAVYRMICCWDDDTVTKKYT
jgi:hypothetical protein